MATAALQCGLPPQTWGVPSSLRLCGDCCYALESDKIVEGVVLPAGTILWHDETDVSLGATSGKWKPITNLAAPAGVKRWGVLEFPVDTTKCDPDIPGPGTIITHASLLAGHKIVWPAGISAANKATYVDVLWDVGIKLTKLSA